MDYIREERKEKRGPSATLGMMEQVHEQKPKGKKPEARAKSEKQEPKTRTGLKTRHYRVATNSRMSTSTPGRKDSFTDCRSERVTSALT